MTSTSASSSTRSTRRGRRCVTSAVSRRCVRRANVRLRAPVPIAPCVNRGVRAPSPRTWTNAAKFRLLRQRRRFVGGARRQAAHEVGEDGAHVAGLAFGRAQQGARGGEVDAGGALPEEG